MKNILFFLTALVLFFGCGKQNKYTLRGSFSGDQNEEYIYLVKFMDSNPQIDSAKIENGRFVFKGNIDFPEVFGLHYNIDRIAGICPVFLEPCEIDVVIDLNDWEFGSKVSGGNINEEYHETQKLAYEIVSLMKNNISVSKIDKERIEKLSKENQESNINYLKNNPTSPISIFLLSKIYFMFPLDELGEILSKFSNEIKNTSIYTTISTDYENQLKLKNSSLALNYHNNKFEVVDVDFKNRSVIEVLKEQNPNKAIYIDIWGTWCGPCIKEFPHSKRLSNNLTSKHLTFVYFCVDSEELEWKKMIKQEGLIGQHFLVSNEVVDKLISEVDGKIEGIPRYILIADDGEIINNNAARPSSGSIEKILTELSNL